jgi:hypothetical protein
LEILAEAWNLLASGIAGATGVPGSGSGAGLPVILIDRRDAWGAIRSSQCRNARGVSKRALRDLLAGSLILLFEP